MPWFKVDDTFATHPKAIAAGAPARGLWVAAGSWCAQQLTDGHVPDYMLATLGGRPIDARRLVTVRLWEVADGGWVFHDWADYQPSRDRVLAEREASRERQRRARQSASSRRDENVSHGVTAPESHGESRSPRPDPTPRRDPVGSRAPTLVDVDRPPLPENAQTLVAEWLDHCDQRPPGRVIGQVSRELKTLLSEDIPSADVRAGLALWHEKLLHPSALASVVHEVRQGPRVRPSTTDARVQAAIDLRDRLRQQEAGDQQRAIGAGA